MPPGTVVNYIITEQCILDKQGGVNMGDSYSLNGNSINAQNGSNVNLGVNNSIQNAEMKDFKQATQSLLQEINAIKTDIDDKYNELANKINQVEKQLEQKEIDKSYIDYLKEGIGRLFAIITKPASLITAYHTWNTCLTALFV